MFPTRHSELPFLDRPHTGTVVGYENRHASLRDSGWEEIRD